jgi:hypothetical protein
MALDQLRVDFCFLILLGDCEPFLVGSRWTLDRIKIYTVQYSTVDTELYEC